MYDEVMQLGKLQAARTQRRKKHKLAIARIVNAGV
jgi:hypothetical protein